MTPSPGGLVDGDLVAFDGTTEVWRAKGFPGKANSFTLMLSPFEKLVARSSSLGLTELFDAESGRQLDTVGNAIVVSPNDDYLIDPPWRVTGLADDARPSPLRVLRVSDGKLTQMATLREADEMFKVGICSTGSTFAVARGSGELIVFRWPDLAWTRADEPAGPGKLRFSRSGRLLATVDGTGEPRRVFALH